MEKTYILAEIRRTTKDGVPLGSRNFTKETGIRDADWKGKHWARWSDAVRDAGLEPNQGRAAFDDDWLIESVIRLIRELGRFPTIAEFRLTKRADPSFPNDGTFRRFGTIPELAATVREYCVKTSGHDDVLVLCEPKAAGATVSESPSPTKTTLDLGFVYLLRSGKHYKIGKSNSAGRRERELAIQLPERVNMVHVIKTDDQDGIERYWHSRFEAKRKNGEWFDLDGAEIAAFKRRKFM
jgi:hypothetical protein